MNISKWLGRLSTKTFRRLLAAVFIAVYVAVFLWTWSALTAGRYWPVIAVFVLASVMLGILIRKMGRP